MRLTLIITLALVLSLSASAFAKAIDQTTALDSFQYMDLSNEANDSRDPGVFGTASHTEFTSFGGTVWDATDGRWEAIEHGVWTFDSGVASAIAGDLPGVLPGADPNKDPSLHAIMEGWVGFDNSFSQVTYFRRLEQTDPRWGASVCVGTAAGLGGNWSFWCGAFQDEANDLCYVAGQGYGNSWTVCIGQTFGPYSGGAITLNFDALIDTEVGYDFVIVEIDTTGSGDVVEAQAYDGSFVGPLNLSLTPGLELPVNTGGNLQFRFCFRADGAWSDEDGLFRSNCGAFAVDNISISGGGISHSTDFETGADGWVLLPAEPGPGGDWSDIRHLSDLPPPLTPCECDLQDSVLVFEDLVAGGHGLFQDNLAGSPWIDLEAAGLRGAPGSILATNLYVELPLLNYIFVQYNVKYFPLVCPATGLLIESPWTSNGFVYYFGGVPSCTSPQAASNTQIEFSAFIPASASDVRIGLGVLSYCRFFANCSGVSNSTPWFDQASFISYGDPSAPFISTRSVNLPQDSFPENGTLNLTSPGRIDSNQTFTGDTLVVYGGGVGPNGDGAEVYLEFEVIPGPGVDPVALAAFFAGKPAGLQGGNWYSARMDTAEINGGRGGSLSWMTAFHEDDPNFSGTDTDLDPGDLDANGGITRLANDIFPDDLFTPGTRINMRHRTNYDSTTPGAGPNFWVPPLSALPIEVEVLPSSMAPGGVGGQGEWNCVLYVNKYGPATSIIETALTSILGTGSANYDNYKWDRYDGRAPSSGGGSWGRQLGSEKGASVVQALGYQCILWNSGLLSAFTVQKGDADILIPWLTLADSDAQRPARLYLSGNGMATSIQGAAASNPSALQLMNDLMGVGLECSTFHEAGCPAGTPLDLVSCVEVDPVAGAPVANGVRSVQHVGQGNGCPVRRGFDVLTVVSPDFGTSTPDERYHTPIKDGDYASIAQDAGGVSLSYKAVLDGISPNYRRDNDTASCTVDSPQLAVEERLSEVLAYLDHGGGGSACEDLSAGTGVGDQIRGQHFHTGLSNFAPNPLLAGKHGTISFTMAREGQARVEIFDVNGRLVRSLFNGVAKKGVTELSWNGTDETGRQVASGVFFYRLTADQQELSKKMVVIRTGGE